MGASQGAWAQLEADSKLHAPVPEVWRDGRLWRPGRRFATSMCRLRAPRHVSARRRPKSVRTRMARVRATRTLALGCQNGAVAMKDEREPSKIPEWAWRLACRLNRVPDCESARRIPKIQDDALMILQEHRTDQSR